MSRQRGFTLFEVLVALTLMALLTVVLFGGFRAGLRSWQALDSHVSSVEDARRLSDLLYRHLSQAMDAPLQDANFQPTLSFDGDSVSMRYIAPLSMSAGDAPHVVEIANAPNGQAGVWMRFAPMRLGVSLDDLFAGSAFQLVSEGLSVRFSYFADGQWMECVSPEHRPVLVAVSISGGQGWPRMVIPVTMTAMPGAQQ